SLRLGRPARVQGAPGTAPGGPPCATGRVAPVPFVYSSRPQLLPAHRRRGAARGGATAGRVAGCDRAGDQRLGNGAALRGAPSPAPARPLTHLAAVHDHPRAQSETILTTTLTQSDTVLPLTRAGSNV